MADLIPLAAVLVAVLLQALVWFRVVRSRAFLVVGAGLLLLSWLAFVLLHGDPDVWDFYASVWFVPFLGLGATALCWLWLGCPRGKV
ncbi:MAG: hypothetical protein Q4D96_05395 [Propionibacteriaceae bacterium]|nr:hypothetical protein [Propionibacteriaceae bacterium]